MCTCTADYTCRTHKTEEERARKERIDRAHAIARRAATVAAATLAKPPPHDAGQVGVLKNAIEDVQGYVTELEG
ncbi:MAG: hypothetical protein JWO67_4033 [Streptosporangiaceae bacterium]|nr:hypothetical protein [Streptosporangiaceae bacterium]